MPWTHPDYPDAIAPAWPLLIEWGVLERKHELTAMRWEALERSRFWPPPDGNPRLFGMLRQAMQRLTKAERYTLEYLLFAESPARLREDFSEQWSRDALNAACERLATILQTLTPSSP